MSRHTDNHLKLSRKIADAVLAAATDGKEVSSALRNDYLNRANSYIVNIVWKMDRKNSGLAGNYLSGLITSQNITFSTAGVDTNANYAYWLSCKKDGSSAKFDNVLDWVDPAKKPLYDAGADLNNSNVYTIADGGKLFAWSKGALISSGTGVFRYLKSDEVADSTGTIAINALWDNIIVAVAATFHWEDKKALTYKDAEALRQELVMRVIG